MDKTITNNTADERLEALLAAADPATSPDEICGCREDLSGRVTNLRRRRRKKRRMAVAALSLASAAAVSFVLLRAERQPAPLQVAAPNLKIPEKTQTAAAETAAVDAKAELAQLRNDIRELREAIKHSRRQAEYRRRLAELRRRARRPDPWVLAQTQLEKTAYILVARAAREETSGRPGDDPAATYRKAIELFPGTTWAKVAQNRLDKHLHKTNPPFSNPPLNSKQEGQL